MISNNNNIVIKRIAKKYFKANYSRNIVAIIAILLTTVLFTTVFTMGTGLIDTVKQENIRKAGGDGQVILSNITDKVFNDVKDNELIDEIAFTKLVADEVQNAKLVGARTEMWYMDQSSIKFAGFHLLQGNLPKQENEIIVDSKTLDLLKCEKKVGEEIQLEYRVKDSIKIEKFKLAGFWETDTISNVGRIIVSEKYLKRHSDELVYTYEQDLNYSGSVSAYIMFKNSKNLDSKITEILESAGYLWEGTTNDESADNYVIARINPAYQSMITLSNPSIAGSLAAAILLIIVVGYLIIFNIFQISVIQDIRFFGQLKTIGTTKRQIHKVIQKQIYWLSLIGIPIGLALGYIIGNLLVPILMKSTEYNISEKTVISMNPIIFVGAAVFSFLTITVSVRKPGRIASNVSALEALQYEDGVVDKKSSKHTSNGEILQKMALSNIGRNKKRTILVIVSLSLSSVLLNTVFTLANGFDENKYVAKFVDKDFILASPDYFIYKFETSNFTFKEEAIDYVKEQPEYRDGGKLITTRLKDGAFYAQSNKLTSVNKDTDGNSMVQIYGAERYLFESMKVLEGQVNFDILNSGEGIVLGEPDNGAGKQESESSIKIGEFITFQYVSENGNTEKFTKKVIAKVLIKENTYTTRQTGEANFYLPEKVFEGIVDTPTIVSYPFDCISGENNIQSMQTKLEQYASTNQGIDFDSKQTYIRAFDGIRDTFVIVGSAMVIVIAFIGIINFINAMVTSVFTRKREFAMMQSVGMTDRQLKKLLCLEGLGYTTATTIVSLVVSIALSVSMVRVISSSIWFFSFHFTLFPVLIISCLFIIISIIVPYILCRKISKESVVERLKVV